MNNEPMALTDLPHRFMTRSLAAIAIFGLVMLAAWFYVIGFGKLSWDGILYTLLAENLSEGAGYRLSPTEPLHVKYFPGYPLLIALVSNVSGDLYFAAGIIPALAAALLVVLVATVGPARDPLRRLIGVLILLFNATFLIFSAMALSEVPFTAAAFLFLSALTRENASRVRTFTMTGALWLSCLLRPEGILLVVALLLERPKKRESKLDYLILLSMPIAGCLCLLVLKGGSLGETYLAWCQWPSPTTIAAQVQAFSLLGLVPIFLAVFGGIARFPSLRPFIIFALLYVSLHLMWYYVDVRLYVPVVPFVAICAAAGLGVVADIGRNRLGVPTWLTIGIVLSLVVVEQIPRLIPGGRQLYQIDSVDYLHVYDSLLELKKNSASVGESCDYLLTNEPVVYSAILKSSARVDSYSSFGEVAAKLCAERNARVCIAADMIHQFVWAPLASDRARQIFEVGCVAGAPMWSSHLPSGYYTELYRCSEIRCPTAPNPSHQE